MRHWANACFRKLLMQVFCRRLRIDLFDPERLERQARGSLGTRYIGHDDDA
jgi:hypothetical protein